MEAKIEKKSQLSKVMRRAWEIYKSGTRNFSIALKEAWKQIRALAAALKAGVIRFWKMDGSITTRNIAPLSNFDYQFKGSPVSTDTVKLVDLSKLTLTGDVNKSIISLHLFQIC